jgi:hypothetical protein
MNNIFIYTCSSSPLPISTPVHLMLSSPVQLLHMACTFTGKIFGSTMARFCPFTLSFSAGACAYAARNSVFGRVWWMWTSRPHMLWGSRTCCGSCGDQSPESLRCFLQSGQTRVRRKHVGGASASGANMLAEDMVVQGGWDSPRSRRHGHRLDWHFSNWYCPLLL